MYPDIQLISLNKQQSIHHILDIEARMKTPCGLLSNICTKINEDLVASHGHHAVSSYAHNFSMKTNRTSVHEERKTFSSVI